MPPAGGAILAGGEPMLLVRGQVSDLVSQDRADEFLARFPQVEFVDVQARGTWSPATAMIYSPRRYWISLSAKEVSYVTPFRWAANRSGL